MRQQEVVERKVFATDAKIAGRFVALEQPVTDEAWSDVHYRYRIVAQVGRSATLFNFPWGIAINATGTVYVTDTFNRTIRKISPDGAVTSIAGTLNMQGSADGFGAAALFNLPSGIGLATARSAFIG
jgi:sugar lactone lactonase YvrE